MAHSRDAVVPPSELRPDVPADLGQVVLKCLAKKPDGRYPTVTALGKSLAGCAAAGEWDAEKAEEWWAGTAPKAPMPAMGTGLASPGSETSNPSAQNS
jgi:eukaryotic-like serine/threonine-protein kinase